jgi:protein tyrosine phosphatase (PTP) superfamily phosphohydrolase (DUF442 family)
MANRLLGWKNLAVAGLLALTGCHSSQQAGCPSGEKHKWFGRCPNCPKELPPDQRLTPAPLPPGAIQVTPGAPIVPSAPVPPSGVPGQPGTPFVPTDPGRNMVPSSQPPLTPGPSTRLDPAPDGVRLTSPQTVQKPSTTVPAAPAASIQAPLDLPLYALAKTRVANGQTPFREGILWLQAQGYRTALFVRAPGEDDAAVRKQFEDAGIRLVSLEVSSRVLTRDAVESFSRTVTEQANLPLFVFDKDGSLTGGLWLLYFRLSEGISEEKALLEAGRLGFKPDLDPEHRAMYDSVRDYLQKQIP